MKYKLLSTVLLTLILAMTIVSAQVSFTTSTPSIFTKTNTQSSFIVTNKGVDTANIEITLPSTIDDGKGHILTITSQSQLVYNNIATNQATSAITVIYSGDTTNFKIGESSSNVIVKATSVTNSSNFVIQTVPLKFINDFCKYGQNGSSIQLGSVEIKNSDGDDTEWKPLDDIKIKVNVENNGNDKVTKVYAEIGVIDKNGKNIVNDLENLDNKKIEVGSISDGDDKDVEFTFKVPADFKEEDYLFVVKAYKDGKESEICSSSSSDLGSTYYETITGARQTDEGKQVVISNIKISPETSANCGERVQVSADITNVGDTDYEDQVKITLYNKDLNVDLEQVIRGDLNQGDSETVDFTFDVPETATEKTYTLEFRTYYDFKSGNSYSLSSDEKFLEPITISGNCVAPTPAKPNLQISAELDQETPEAIAGKQVIIKATLKNNGNTEASYTVSAYGNSAWSSLVSVQPESITLKSGESKQVSIALNVDKEAEGDKEFTIKATSGSSSVEQRVALTVSKSQVQFTAISDHLKKNWFIYLIVLVNVVLIVAIILVIRRMVSPRKRRDFD